MMTCGGSNFRTNNNYNNGSYLGPPPIELRVEGDELLVIPRYYDYSTTYTGNKYITVESKPNNSEYYNKTKQRVNGKYNNTTAYHGDRHIPGVTSFHFNDEIYHDNFEKPTHFGNYIETAYNHNQDYPIYWYIKATYRDTDGGRLFSSSNIVKIEEY